MNDNELQPSGNDDAMREIIRASRANYHRLQDDLPPATFDEFMRRKGVGRKKRMVFSAAIWQLVAACVVGVIAGWFMPRTGNADMPLLAVADTVFVSRIDTVFLPEQKVTFDDRNLTKSENKAIRHDRIASGVSPAARKKVIHVQSSLPNSVGSDILPGETGGISDHIPTDQKKGISVSQNSMPLDLLVSF